MIGADFNEHDGAGTGGCDGKVWHPGTQKDRMRQGCTGGGCNLKKW